MAAGPADLWPAHALARHSASEAPRTRRTTHAPQTLAGVYPLRHGAHSLEDDHRRGARRSKLRLGPCLRPGSHRPSGGLACRSTTRLSRQHFHRARLLPRNLFPHARPLRLVESNLGESPHYLKISEGRLRCLVGFKIQTPPSPRPHSRRLKTCRLVWGGHSCPPASTFSEIREAELFSNPRLQLPPASALPPRKP